MAEQCFEDHGRFIYQMCWFEKAEQRESYSNRVSLGSWSAFEDNYSTLVFGPGAPCANAPPRSFRVSLVCGVEEKLTDSSEPSTCVYTAKLSTPLVCTAKDLADAEAQLRQLMEWEAKVKLEIAAEKASAARSGHDEL